jgi:hypothetical protein
MSRFPEEKDEITKALRALDWLWDLLHRIQHGQPGPSGRTRKHDPPPDPAWKIEITYLPEGAALVRINAGPAFVLTEKLARLLEILASGPVECDDGTVGWKQTATVISQLSRHGGGNEMSAKAFNNQVYRLRRALANAGYHPKLVTRHRVSGSLRFLLRPAVNPVGSSHD